MSQRHGTINTLSPPVQKHLTPIFYSNNSSEQTKEMKNKTKEIITNWITAKGKGNFPTLSFSM